MEKIIESEEIRKFVTVDEFPTGSGSGSGSGDGDGSGYGSGYGDGDGSGYGDGSGSGDGDGSGSGYGDGSGSGYGYGSGDGDGSGSGYGYNIEYISGKKVYKIDGISTIIDSVHGNSAKGRILNSDLTTKSCYIAKCGNYFAHGETLKQAMLDARNKYKYNAPIEDRIARFNAEYPDRDKKVPAADLFNWHNILTGSCLMGRQQFCEEHGLDYENGLYTVNEFIAITRNAYGGDIINQLADTLPSH